MICCNNATKSSRLKLAFFEISFFVFFFIANVYAGKWIICSKLGNNGSGRILTFILYIFILTFNVPFSDFICFACPRHIQTFLVLREREIKRKRIGVKIALTLLMPKWTPTHASLFRWGACFGMWCVFLHRKHFSFAYCLYDKRNNKKMNPSTH